MAQSGSLNLPACSACPEGSPQSARIAGTAPAARERRMASALPKTEPAHLVSMIEIPEMLEEKALWMT